MHMRTGSPHHMQTPVAPPLEEDEDDEELGIAETYNDYMPAKCE